ncbi:unnamed protein product [Auanema sp. JU1783]|nr:unnamed protein product [Auanema sp. JU1783]
MGIYLTKKISIPTNTDLLCIEWNLKTKFIAAGGTNGILKIVKLNPLDLNIQRDSKGASNNMSVNQNLEGHTGAILNLTWNEIYHKLTSADSNGLITVWSHNNDNWYEEMINNRNKSVVVGMSWNTEGTCIAIAYQNGQVIVGTNDGNKSWRKSLEATLVTVEWTPDGTCLLFGIQDGEVHLFDNKGNFIQKLSMPALENVELEAALAKDLRKDQIVALKWWRPSPIVNKSDEDADSKKQRFAKAPSLDAASPGEKKVDNRPRLMIAYAHGVIQLMRHDADPKPIVVRYDNLTITSARWSPNGSFIAVTGYHVNKPNLERCYLYILSAFGVKQGSLNIPGTNLTGCAWDSNCLRVALSMDSNLFFANIRPHYKWGYCGQTVIYVYERDDRNEFRIIFFETKLEETYKRSIKNFEQIACYGDYCIIVNRANDAMGTFYVQLCNSIGTPLDYKYVEVEPCYVAMNETAAVIAGSESYFIWYFSLPKRTTLGVTPYRPQAEDIVHGLDSAAIGNELGMRRKFQRGNDRITALCMGDSFFLLACESGALFKINLSNGSVIQRFSIPQNIIQMQLNASYKRIATLDQNHTLQFFDLDETSVNKVLNMDKADIWCFLWDAENEDTIAYSEKTKLVIMRGEKTEEPVYSSGYICFFKDLTVKAVLVDYFLLEPTKPSKNYVIEIEMKILRDAKGLLERMKIEEASEFIERNPHPKLWQLLAEVALHRLDISTAEHAYVKLSDYGGLQFCKRLTNVQHNGLKKAEIEAHLGQLEAAERTYIDNDRRDLAVEMYRKNNNWLKVMSLLNQGGVSGVNEDVLRHEAWNRIGDHYADRQKWDMAAKHYEQARNLDKLLYCYLKMDDYVGLDILATNLPDGHHLLEELGFVFGSAGLCDQSVNCYIRNDKIPKALDVCIQLNQWDMAVQLSRTHKLRDVDALLGKYAQELTGSNERTLAAVQLYKRAGRFLDAARIVFEIADDERKKVAECLRLKKLYVMGALLIEEYHIHQKSKSVENKGKEVADSTALLSGLLEEDSSISLDDSRMIDRAWRGALAYHFFMLAQRQLYDGNIDGAVKTSMHLTEYDDILDPVEVYSLLALSSCANRQFSVASRAFIRLESLDSNENKEDFQKLALKIFSQNPPTDSRTQQESCPNCDQLVADYAQYCPHCDTKFPICVATGRPLLEYSFILCNVCHQKSHEKSMNDSGFCALCHATIV